MMVAMRQRRRRQLDAADGGAIDDDGVGGVLSDGRASVMIATALYGTEVDSGECKLRCVSAMQQQCRRCVLLLLLVGTVRLRVRVALITTLRYPVCNISIDSTAWNRCGNVRVRHSHTFLCNGVPTYDLDVAYGESCTMDHNYSVRVEMEALLWVQVFLRKIIDEHNKYRCLYLYTQIAVKLFRNQWFMLLNAFGFSIK